ELPRPGRTSAAAVARRADQLRETTPEGRVVVRCLPGRRPRDPAALAQPPRRRDQRRHEPVFPLALICASQPAAKSPGTPGLLPLYGAAHAAHGIDGSNSVPISPRLMNPWYSSSE